MSLVHSVILLVQIPSFEVPLTLAKLIDAK